MIHTITNLQHIHDVWGAISSHLEPCFDERCTKQDVYDNLMSGEWTLLSITDGDKPVVLATVSYIYYPSSTSLSVILLAGEADSWPDLMEQLEELAIANGAFEIEI